MGTEGFGRLGEVSGIVAASGHCDIRLTGKMERRGLWRDKRVVLAMHHSGFAQVSAVHDLGQQWETE